MVSFRSQRIKPLQNCPTTEPAHIWVVACVLVSCISCRQESTNSLCLSALDQMRFLFFTTLHIKSPSWVALIYNKMQFHCLSSRLPIFTAHLGCRSILLTSHGWCTISCTSTQLKFLEGLHYKLMVEFSKMLAFTTQGGLMSCVMHWWIGWSLFFLAWPILGTKNWDILSCVSPPILRAILHLENTLIGALGPRVNHEKQPQRKSKYPLTIFNIIWITHFSLGSHHAQNMTWKYKHSQKVCSWLKMWKEKKNNIKALFIWCLHSQ